jgi:hypothetical protein
MLHSTPIEQEECLLIEEEKFNVKMKEDAIDIEPNKVIGGRRNSSPTGRSAKLKISDRRKTMD